MSIFGSTTATTGTGFGGFGATTNNQQQQQPQQQQQGTSLFGSAPAQPAPGGSIFGSAAPATSTTGGSLFGGGTQQQPQQQPQAGSLFGGATAGTGAQAGGGLFGSAPAQPQQSASNGLFGSTTAQQQQQQPAAGGLFGGATTQPATGGGLFGATNNATSLPTTGGGLFGNTNTAQNTTGGGLFGATSTAPATGSLFGSNTATTPSNATGGLFGSVPQQQQPVQGSTSLFGQTAPATAATSLFGQQQPKPAGSLFGTASSGGLLGQSTLGQSTLGQSTFGQSPLGQSMLGQSTLGQSTLGLSALGPPSLGQSTLGLSALGPPARTNSLLGTRGTLIPAPNSTSSDPAVQAAQLAARIEAIYMAWNAQSPSCRFQRYFYNLVDPATVSRYGRPPNAVDEAAWQKAVAENPDPSCLVPVLAVGFDDLAQRVEAQTQQSAAHTQTLEDLRKRLTALQTSHSTASAPRLQRAAQAQAQLAHRLRALVQHLHLLIPALRASALRPEEEALRTALEALDDEIRGGVRGGAGGMGRLRTRLNELWALLGAVSAARERELRGGAGKVGWKVVDEDSLRELAGVLGEQQAGLAHLTKVLKKDLRDLEVVEGKEVRDESGKIKDMSGSVLGR